jgi:hypothetical protein
VAFLPGSPMPPIFRGCQVRVIPLQKKEHIAVITSLWRWTRRFI